MAELVPKYLDPSTVRVVLGDIPVTTAVSFVLYILYAVSECPVLQLLELPWDHSTLNYPRGVVITLT